jgi:hypothetical protein
LVGQSFYAYCILISGIKAYTSIETDFRTKMTVLCTIKGKGIMRGCDALDGPPVLNFIIPGLKPLFVGC